MFSYLPKSCNENCGIDELLVLLDKKIAKEIIKNWNIKRFLAKKTFCDRSYKNLIRYKRIAEKLKFNVDYLEPEISVSDFISKVKIAVR